MTILHALSRILAMNIPVFTTSDVATQLGVPNANASVVLARLEKSSQVLRLRRGVWAIKDRIDPLALPEYLTAPFPAYVSLHSALYLHGMISQIPAVTYAVSLARTRRYATPLGTVSIHHVQPSFFFGFEAAGRAGGRLATPEKALVDFLYLAPARSKLFRALPELSWPRGFKVRLARSILKRVTPLRRQRIVARKLEELLQTRR
jgi:predicted transcriptional regulator of viral defense system